jgi:hypothetical protein
LSGSQVEVLKKEITGNPEWLPIDRLTRLPALRHISYVAMVLAQWNDMTRSEGPEGCAQFLVANKDVIITAERLKLWRDYALR